jgi:hypothetical protein
MANKVLNLDEILEIEKPHGLRVEDNHPGYLHVTACRLLSTFDIEVDCATTGCDEKTYIIFDAVAACKEHLVDNVLAHVNSMAGAPAL